MLGREVPTFFPAPSLANRNCRVQADLRRYWHSLAERSSISSRLAPTSLCKVHGVLTSAESHSNQRLQMYLAFLPAMLCEISVHFIPCSPWSLTMSRCSAIEKAPSLVIGCSCWAVASTGTGVPATTTDNDAVAGRGGPVLSGCFAARQHGIGGSYPCRGDNGKHRKGGCQGREDLSAWRALVDRKFQIPEPCRIIASTPRVRIDSRQ